MYYLLLRHQVADFAEWRVFYEAQRHLWRQAGLTEALFVQTVDKPNEVTLVFAVRELAQAQAFIRSPALQQALQDAGVLGQSELTFLTT